MSKVVIITYIDFCQLVEDLLDQYEQEAKDYASVESFLDAWFSEFCSTNGVEGIVVDEGDEVEYLFKTSEFITYLAKEGWLEDFLDIWRLKRGGKQ
jgi:hypothetical protein